MILEEWGVNNVAIGAVEKGREWVDTGVNHQLVPQAQEYPVFHLNRQARRGELLSDGLNQSLGRVV